MGQSNKPLVYSTGADFWRDSAVNYGMDEAAIICGNYIDMNLSREQSDTEKQFCREIFTAMYEATAGKTDAAKLVYPYPFEEADKRLEASFYCKSRSRNHECARAIDDAISASHYKPNHYNLNTAVMRVLLDYGFARVNLVLAFNIQWHESDGRLSSTNKSWAKEFIVTDKEFNDSWLRSHLTLVEDFCGYVRRFYESLGAERFDLPGKPESGEYVQGFEITRVVMVGDNQGYAVAYNPNAVSPYVCWQFNVMDGERSYNWGYYADDEKSVTDNYIARVIAALG
jgi:hypothetical protein